MTISLPRRATTDSAEAPASADSAVTLSPDEAASARDAMRRVITQVERVVVGKRSVVELCVLALLARGHVLLEDVPGVGKTMLAKAFARAVQGDFKRIQFTPDLLPGDVTGLSIYNPGAGEWKWTPGPVFCNVLLADEINRATPKTQSALLEAMEEAQVTTDGVSRALPRPFLTIATQNPIEYRGTYPLPEAQMDRFLFRSSLGYPTHAEEVEMVMRHARFGAIPPEEKRGGNGVKVNSGQANNLLASVEPVLGVEEIAYFQSLRQRVTVARPLCEYIVDVAHATRAHLEVALGASPRSCLALQRAVQARALLDGRAFATPDDVKILAPHVLSHRLLLGGEDLDRRAAQEIVHSVLTSVPVR